MKSIEEIMKELTHNLEKIKDTTKEVTPYFFSSISRIHYHHLIEQDIETKLEEMYKRISPDLNSLINKARKYKSEYSIQAVTELYGMGFDDYIGFFHDDNKENNSDFYRLIKCLEKNNYSSFDLVEPYNSVLTKIKERFNEFERQCLPFWKKVQVLRYDNRCENISVYQTCTNYISNLRQFMSTCDKSYDEFSNRINSISDDIRAIGNCTLSDYYEGSCFSQIESALKDMEKTLTLHKVLAVAKENPDVYENGTVYKSDLKKWNK